MELERRGTAVASCDVRLAVRAARPTRDEEINDAESRQAPQTTVQ